ncbi:MAG: hypothetical protein OXH22_03405 [Chloroflexi bacterium]|nr:hypothetical protein [Chloroflexota bacterium]
MNAHSAWDIDEKVEELLASPAGCAFLVVLQESGVSTADAVHPAISLQAAYRAINKLSIWRPNFQETVKFALLNGRKLSELARAILELPEVGWWFAPIDRKAQTWAASRDDAPTLAKFNMPSAAPLTYWERRTNKSDSGLYTCTSFEGNSSFLTAMDISDVNGPNDLTIEFEFPVKQWRLRVSDAARVYEINGPADWHRLCAKYPAGSARDASDPSESDNEGWTLYPLATLPRDSEEQDFATDMASWLTPNWSAVAAEWDGVHLTLGGLLTAEKVRVASAAGWSMLRFWDMEQTMWLRWVFDDVERLPDRDAIPLPVELYFPFADYRAFLDAEGKDYGGTMRRYTFPD